MEKKFLGVLALALISWLSCSKPVHVRSQTIVIGVDFTDFARRGFLFTPEKYLGSYESMGLISIICFPEVKEDVGLPTSGEKWPKGGERGTARTPTTWRIGRVQTQEVLEEAYQVATKMGANAVVSLRFEDLTKRVKDVEVRGLEVSGFAIKRTDIP